MESYLTDFFEPEDASSEVPLDACYVPPIPSPSLQDLFSSTPLSSLSPPMPPCSFAISSASLSLSSALSLTPSLPPAPFPAQAASFSSQFVSSPFAASVSCLSSSYPLRGPPPSPSILHRSSPQLCDLSPSLVHDLSLPLSSCSSPSLALTCDSSPQSLLPTATHPDNFPPPGLPPQCFISSAFAMSSDDLLMSPVNSYPLLQSPTP